jgi:two-component system, cell cycle sensor histidine kinase and response regulator CckA
MDITERKQAADLLRASETRSHAIIQTALDGFWITDIQGRLLQVNAAYCRMSGYSEQELLGMAISELEAKEEPAETNVHIQVVMALGSDRFETRHRRRDGSVFDIEVAIQYQAADSGRMVCFLCDFSERKRSEKELWHLNRALRTLSACNEALVRAKDGLPT